VAAYDPRTALLVVDVQNDFADPSGGLSVPGGAEIVPTLNQEIGAALEAGAAVIYTQDWHPATTPHFAKDGGIWPVHCVDGTWGAAFHPELLLVGPSVRKGVDGGDGYSGFSVRDPASGDEHATELESLLRERGIERVVIGGLATDYCVRETVLDAIERGFTATVLTDAIAAVELKPGDGAAALEDMAAAGALLTAADGGG
jgi:nicotinamidase/pyrazinamidase